MNPKEIVLMIKALSQQRGLDQEVIATALEHAIAGAASKQLHCPHENIKVTIDRDNGYYTILERVVSEQEKESMDEEGESEVLTEEEEAPEYRERKDIVFDRIAIQTAKQLILQKVREAERQQLVEDYRPKLGRVLAGTVKRITRMGDVIVLLNDRVEAIMPKEALLPQDRYYPDDEICGVLENVDSEKSSHQLYLSRTNEDMIRGLFMREVPEVAQKIVEIRAIARLPGLRCKVAVRAKDKRIDAMSACIGMQGKRVQAVEEELRGEKIDILEWDDSPEKLVKNVLANRNIHSVTINPVSHTIDVAADAEHIGEILGRNGQNVRLAVRLIGWDINVMREDEAKEKHEQDQEIMKQQFVRILDVDDDIAQDLINSQFSSIQQIAYASAEKLLRIKDFDEDLVEELRKRANDYLISEAFENEAVEQLMHIEGVDDKIASRLMEHGILLPEKLAECSLDELEDMLGDLYDEKTASQIILAARHAQR